MINLARIHSYKAGIFQLFEVPKHEARRMVKHLIANGFVVTHTELV